MQLDPRIHQKLSKATAQGKFWTKRWHLISGCSKVSDGCAECWMEKEARLRENHPIDSVRRLHEGLLTGSGKWNGTVRFNHHLILLPLFTKNPEIFALWTDLFHEDVSYANIDRAMAIMLASHQAGLKHLFIAPTKRAVRQQEYFASRSPGEHLRVWWRLAREIAPTYFQEGILREDTVLDTRENFPLPNMLGCVTTENQIAVDTRYREFLTTPFRKRLLLAEPLLDEIRLPIAVCEKCHGTILEDGLSCPNCGQHVFGIKLDAVITAGESGHNARPANPKWFRSLRDQTSNVGAAFFFKSWGEWLPHGQETLLHLQLPDKFPITSWHGWPDGNRSLKVGKKAAGRLLDGREHIEVLN